MWHLIAYKISISLSFLNWIKNKMIFYCISELMLAALIQRYSKIISFQEREMNWNFTGCQVPHFMIVLIPYIIKPFLDNKMSILEDYGAFKTSLKTCLYNFDPIKPHVYIVKLEFTGVYIIFLISAQKHRLRVLVRTASRYSLEPPRWGGSNEYPQSMFWAEIWKISSFVSENFHFLEVKFSIY